MSSGVIDLEKMRARLGKASSFLARSGGALPRKSKKEDVDDEDKRDEIQSRIDDKYAKTRKQHTELRSLIKQNEYADKDAIRMLGALLGITLNMMPMAEKAVYKYGNERAIYAWNALVSQAREIINDIRLVQDLTQQADRVFEIFVGVLRDIARSMVEDVYRLKVNVKETTKRHDAVNKLLDKFATRQADVMEDHLGKAQERINALMLEPTSAPNAGKGKRKK